MVYELPRELSSLDGDVRYYVAAFVVVSQASHPATQIRSERHWASLGASALLSLVPPAVLGEAGRCDPELGVTGRSEVDEPELRRLLSASASSARAATRSRGAPR